MIRDLAVEQFLDVLLDMPDIEALQEIDLRKDHLALQHAMLQTERARFDSSSKRHKDIGGEMLVINKDLSCMNLRRKEINARLDRTNWAKAVTALYGQEGFEACREWMAMHTDKGRT